MAESSEFGANISLIKGISNPMPILKQCDLFILPSYYEGLPMALLEAMSFGLVPVVTSVGSIPMVITHGFNGFFVPLKESAGIVDSIIQLAEDPDMFRTMSKNAQGTIFEMFDDELAKKNINILLAYNGLSDNKKVVKQCA